ncbi:MAG: 5-methyltetrahydropteroyltriglutamate--homocysteine S-methyltransferase [Defluviicoccus sp.]|nr:5-methyltetrahydropteroyltriglutamate--homocysteine S-methyltransferase [Defluviicoccus sp.]MDE0275746.1 5-methyltetrahydropteroyltriglutamate--homocysteine S-methyltransferase [Defluviicoccus sp.]
MPPDGTPPFRAEHIGSLLRPDALRDGFRRLSKGEIDADGFRVIQDECIRDAVAMQEEIGFETVTDGEFRRTTYISHFVDSVEGLEFAPSSFQFYEDDGTAHEFVAPRAVGRLERVKANSGEEFDFLRTVAGKTVKSTLPSPATMHFLGGAEDPPPDVYPDREALFEDLARAYREDIADLAARGARYVQIDDVPFAMLCDESLRHQLAAQGEDAEALVDAYIGLTNDALAGRPADMTVGFHICRGNLKGTWLSRGGYDAVAEKLFARLDVDHFCLEYDTERAGGFSPLAAMPEDKGVVLGLISSKLPLLEDPAAVEARIAEASRYVPLDRLAVSPQCGFSSAVIGNPVRPDDQRAKLALVVEIAGRVWKNAAR